MKYFKIAVTGKALPPLTDVPEEYKFVESIARRYANKVQELEAYYKIGVTAAIEFRENLVEDESNRYDRFVAWVVNQTIFRTIMNATSK